MKNLLKVFIVFIILYVFTMSNTIQNLEKEIAFLRRNLKEINYQYRWLKFEYSNCQFQRIFNLNEYWGLHETNKRIETTDE